jgi:hypothetical protein
MLTFRIHFADGAKISVNAHTPAEARTKAQRQRPGIIAKIKLARDNKYPSTALAFAASVVFGLAFCTFWMGIPA